MRTITVTLTVADEHVGDDEAEWYARASAELGKIQERSECGLCLKRLKVSTPTPRKKGKLPKGVSQADLDDAKATGRKIVLKKKITKRRKPLTAKQLRRIG